MGPVDAGERARISDSFAEDSYRDPRAPATHIDSVSGAPLRDFLIA